MTHQTGHFVRFKEACDAAGQLPNDARFPLLHRGDIHLHASMIDAVFGEFVFRTVIQL